MQRRPTTQTYDTKRAAPEQPADRQDAPPSYAKGPAGPIDRALQGGQTFEARTALYEAEQAGGLGLPEIAGWKARIAIAEQDFPAARAILVSAIERFPDAASLRPLLNEVLIAVGNAAYARDVQAHLGHSVPEYDMSDDRDDGTGG